MDKIILFLLIFSLFFSACITNEFNLNTFSGKAKELALSGFNEKNNLVSNISSSSSVFEFDKIKLNKGNSRMIIPNLNKTIKDKLVLVSEEKNITEIKGKLKKYSKSSFNTNSSVLRINFNFGECSSGTYTIFIIHNSELELLDQGTEYACEFTKEYELYEEDDFDLFVELIRSSHAEGKSISFFISSFNASSALIETDINALDGIVIDHGINAVADSFGFKEELFVKLLTFRLPNEFSYTTGILQGGFKNRKKNVLRINVSNNLNNKKYKFYSLIDFSAFNSTMAPRLVVPFYYTYPYNDPGIIVTEKDFKKFYLTSFNAIKNSPIKVNRKSFSVSPVFFDGFSTGSIGYWSPSLSDPVLPVTTKLYLFNGYDYFINSLIEKPIENPFQEINSPIEFVYLTLKTSETQFLEQFKNPFSLNLFVPTGIQEYIAPWQDFRPYFFNKFNADLIGCHKDVHGNCYSLSTNNGSLIIITPSGQVISHANGGVWWLSCNSNFFYPNRVPIYSCEEGKYLLYWKADNIYNNSTPCLTAELYYDGEKFSILNQEKNDFFEAKQQSIKKQV